MAEITAYVALGANLGDPVTQIHRALDELARLPDTRLLASSSLYQSKPVGFLDQPDYVNAVAALATHLTPRALLDRLLDVETRHGRTRAFKNAPRTLDLDLLLYDGLVMHEPGLTLPHPRMLERAFVMLPLAEIAPDCLIPGQGAARDWLDGLDRDGLTRIPTATWAESAINASSK
ncbi:MAG: 2-amino-4-hydroxy-6-hydroxymethyldihydropteridine diphosphokinase [Pseudomonadota bacterium]